MPSFRNQPTKNMKILSQKVNLTHVLLLCVVATMLFGCERKVKFRKVKEGKSQGISPFESIDSYTLRFNLEANGTVFIHLSNGAAYEAIELNASQMSSLLTLLQIKEIQFDVANDEFVLEKPPGE